jgi:FMN phosphatase YigB (HAD superfamily)
MRYFDAFVVSAEEKCMKPDMGMFRPALDAIGVTPEQVLFVDDARSIIGIEAVQANGFRTVLADYEHVHPDWPYRITSIGQVLDFTEKLAW